MNGTSPLGFLGICLAFALTAFLGGLAGSLLLGDDDDAGASTPVAQGTPRPGSAVGSGASGATGTAVVVAPTLPPAAAATNTVVAAATATPAATTYTVVSGDTLTGIAIKQNIAVDQRTAWIQQVRTLNSITGDNISVGQTLRLPPATSGAAPAGTPAAGAATATRPAGTPAAAPAAATATRTP